MSRVHAVLVVASLFLLGTYQAESADAPAAPQGRRFACADYTQGKVFLVGADGKVEWEHPAPSCNDLWVLPNGNLLFTTGHGVLELTREKKEVFSYKSSSEIYACQRLPDGNTFVGECSSGKLLEVDPAGKVVKEIKLLPNGDGGHAFMRNARRLPNGNYLCAHYGLGVVREYDPQGQQVLEIKAPGNPHSVARLPNGNTLIAAGDAKGAKECKVFEVNPKGETVWQVSSADLPPELGLKFASGFHRLPNGNTVITNWLGHGQFGKSAHVIEVTPEKKVVWTFADHKTMKTISTIVMLEDPGNPITGQVAH
jgi:hypothetical protein